MEEEFYATIKLVSGEEIIARVAYMPEEESCLLHEPMQVEHVKQKNKVDGFTLTEWIHSTFDDLFVLPKIHILTMTECCEKIEKFYLKCLASEKQARALAAYNRERKIDTEKLVPGYVGSVDKTRELLEKIYNKESS